ncbi:hypothetical protein E1A91_D05G135800v1 [Gossypium mustelinum]|uniref:DUF4220 domain-containing protein n=4 Tax=Gossypium TaxID=3633 RepID=A0A5D2UXA2_GOSMU|nr:uncharacterized protein LOC107906494 [Gossypium hirsutum]KAB2028937.1 hypothetical protein ES319_D05G130200v1 [Gossypium barbadense]TYG68211.1 hypothetical protein ES288_D05G136100v1 [Gossypium darwinii]TYI81163.1 hypothetical protein E1A91_D05G135800v1 [Gossypium mustelinum]TYI81164.1 hypothetical protein E1A91_D05G135800v1 [Gossypium mustelinum]
MIVTIASALLFIEIKDAAFLRTLSQVMLSLWLKWELRAMVVLSLSVQLILIKFGNRRKNSGRHLKIVSLLVWTMYLFADWLATVALSTLLRSRKEQITSPLVIFWTPFLLLHLGGPDTITAYSLSDNELWPRHLFGLCFQVGVALYVYVKFWTLTVTKLTYLAIPIFIVGIIKYGERVRALFQASNVRFRKSVFSTDKASELEVELSQGASKSDITLEGYLDRKQIKEKYRYLYRAFLLFQVFRPMFSDLKLRIYNKLDYIFELGENVVAEEAFKIVEIELGFLYDLLYTKIPIVITRIGVILRIISLSLITSTLIAFLLVVGKHGYSKVDIGISYLLMVGAIFLELYSAFLHLSSDWGIHWLTSQNNRLLTAAGSNLVHFSKPNKGIRAMAQHSLLDYCLQPRKLKLAKVLNIFDPEDNAEKYLHTSWKDVDLELQKIIYTHFKEKRRKYKEKQFEYKELLELLEERGRIPLIQNNVDADLGWSVSDVEFTHSLLLWHIATDVVYNDDHHWFRAGKLGPYCRISKLLSDYMMYLLFLCPEMLPEGIGTIRHHDTCIEAKNFVHDKSKFKQVIRGLFGIDIESRSFFVLMGSLKKSAFFEGCQIAVQLQTLLGQFRWDHEDKWKLIAEVWLDMLTYVAAQCSWKEHARQLQQGEELLTHVALLMAHLGLSKKIQMVPLPKRLQEVEYEPTFYWDRLDRLPSYLA